jgi:rhodanese-related sulfurtransferase
VNRADNCARISTAEFKERLLRKEEWALLDMREEGTFSAGHLLLATCVPLSKLEVLVADLVPRRTTPVMLCGGDALAEQAAAKLACFGYDNVAVLPGTPDDWKAAGLEVYTGLHVPSKGFGEFVEGRLGTPHIAADELKRRLAAGEDIVILDSRPLDEYRTRNIPGAVDVPGVELVYRIKDLVTSDKTLVVVNCGGRTRSIIGAQLLINAGVPNPVVALQNGTMGWHLAGYPLEHGQARRAPPVSPQGMDWCRTAAKRLAGRFGVQVIDRSRLAEWQADGQRTLYLFDVRQPDEYAMGHLPGARPVQGGQLVQETDRFIAVRNARIVLTDDTGVRATATASWLLQMGLHDVYVFGDALAGVALETGSWHHKALGLYESACEGIHAEYLLHNFKHEQITVIDFSASPAYRKAHIPGAYFAIRSRIAEGLKNLFVKATVVLTSEDGLLAQLAAPEVASLTPSRVKVLLGGNNAWRAAGGKLESGRERFTVPPDDVWLKPFDQLHGRVEDRLASYLRWESGLVAQLQRDAGIDFRLPK